MESSLKTMSLHQIIRLGWVDCLPDHNACGTWSDLLSRATDLSGILPSAMPRPRTRPLLWPSRPLASLVLV